jgi:hypothetical protein
MESTGEMGLYSSYIVHSIEWLSYDISSHWTLSIHVSLSLVVLKVQPLFPGFDRSTLSLDPPHIYLEYICNVNYI